MKKLIQIVIIVVVLTLALGYWFDIPYLNRSRDIVDKVSGNVSLKSESAGDCTQCDQICNDQYRECLQEKNCDEFGDQNAFRECSEKCLDRYRACYLGCKGKFGAENCPQPSLSGVF